MRTVLLAALVLSCSSAISYAADDATDRGLEKAEQKAVDNKSVNTIDPVTGDKVDAHFAPVSAKAKDGKEILIGVSSEESARTIKKDPGRYVDCALANKKSEEK